jgi:hypothetical protein
MLDGLHKSPADIFWDHYFLAMPRSGKKQTGLSQVLRLPLHTPPRNECALDQCLQNVGILAITQ